MPTVVDDEVKVAECMRIQVVEAPVELAEGDAAAAGEVVGRGGGDGGGVGVGVGGGGGGERPGA